MFKINYTGFYSLYSQGENPLQGYCIVKGGNNNERHIYGIKTI